MNLVVKKDSGLNLLNVGYGNLVPAQRIVAVLQPDSMPARRLREDAAEKGKLLDATQGRRTRSLVVLDTSHVLLSAVQAHTLAARLQGESPEGEAEEDGET